MSIIKAALLARLTGDLPCLKGAEQDLGLFAQAAAQDADGLALPALVMRLAEKSSLAADWLLANPGRSLQRLIAANLRYSSPDRAAVIFAAIDQAVTYGPEYCFSGIGDLSRLFVTRYRAVAHEVHRMLGFIRFHPAPDNTLVAQPKLFHDTGDLILRKFAPRYPGSTLVLLLADSALLLANGNITVVSPENYLRYVQNDPFVAAWDEYYRSQYIASRKNISHASRCLPKKYWDWAHEGSILAEEAKK
jgi:probable DNA metabolism protein